MTRSSINDLTLPLDPQATAASEALPAPVVQSNVESAADTEARRLATAIERGDERAFQELYDRYHGRLYRLALVLGRGDETLASETVQSVFLVAAAKLRAVSSEAHLWHWLARVARQQIVRARRLHSLDAQVVTMDPLPECIDGRASEAMLEQQLDLLLLELAPHERLLVEAFYFENRSHKELAAQLGTTTKAISGRLERARARLRAFLRRSPPHDS